MDSSTCKAANAVGKKDAGTMEDVISDLNAIRSALADIEDAEAICSRLPGATYPVIKHLLQNHLLSAKVRLMQMNLLKLDKGGIINDTGTIASDSTTSETECSLSSGDHSSSNNDEGSEPTATKTSVAKSSSPTSSSSPPAVLFKPGTSAFSRIKVGTDITIQGLKSESSKSDGGIEDDPESSLAHLNGRKGRVIGFDQRKLAYSINLPTILSDKDCEGKFRKYIVRASDNCIMYGRAIVSIDADCVIQHPIVQLRKKDSGETSNKSLEETPMQKS